MINLHGSRWAPSSSRRNYVRVPGQNTESVNSNIKNQLLPPNYILQYNRFLRLHRRLKWKSTFLLLSHDRALSLTNTEGESNIKAKSSSPHSFPMDFFSSSSDTLLNASHVQTMFKIDFFEYYVLLERVLVSLLGVWDIEISGFSSFLPRPTPAVPVPSSNSTPSSLPSSNPYNTRSKMQDTKLPDSHTNSNSNPKKKKRGIGDTITFPNTITSTHSFHANVLSALDNTNTNNSKSSRINPKIHEILGTGKVRRYLGVAKDFRNRWKNVDLTNDINANANANANENTGNNHINESKTSDGTGNGNGVDVGNEKEKKDIFMPDINLKDMLISILDALDNAAVIAKEEIDSRNQSRRNHQDQDKNENGNGTIEERQLQYEYEYEMMDVEFHDHDYQEEEEENGAVVLMDYELDEMEWD